LLLAILISLPFLSANALARENWEKVRMKIEGGGEPNPPKGVVATPMPRAACGARSR
jgi:hypothetical protein